MKIYPLKPIKDDKQYFAYCNELEKLVLLESAKEEVKENIEHLTILIEAWDEKYSSVPELDPVGYLKLLMQNHDLKPIDLQKKTGLSKTLISHLLNYRRSFSKNTIKVLSECFAVSQEAFNRSYVLKNTPNGKVKIKEEKRKKIKTTAKI